MHFSTQGTFGVKCKAPPARRRTEKPDKFAIFDHALFVSLRTAENLVLWNRSRSMLGNGHKPSQVAKTLHLAYGIAIGPTGDTVPADTRYQPALDYFARLVVPEDAPGAPSIFGEVAGAC